MQVQAVVPELAVEALDKGVLSRLAGLDEVKPGFGAPGPEEHCLAREFRAVVADDRARQCPVDPVQLTGHPMPGDRKVGDLEHAFSGEVVHDVQHPETPTVGELVGDKVHGPPLIGAFGQRHRNPRPVQLLSSLGANLKAFLAVDPIRPLRVQDQPLGSEHVV